MRFGIRTLVVLSSLAVLVLTVFTIAIFIVDGYTILFYAVLAVALAFALFNAWLIAREEGRRRPRASAGLRRTANRKRYRS